MPLFTGIKEFYHRQNESNDYYAHSDQTIII